MTEGLVPVERINYIAVKFNLKMGAVKRQTAFVLSVCTVIILNLTASAQQWIPNFKHYGIRDGLPSSEVYQITSDPQKNLWFVTDRGVVRYDGTVFRVFDKKDSLPENSIIKVYKDWKERVWFISYTGLLSYYENGKIIPYRFNHVIRQNLGIQIFGSIYVDRNETIFINGIGGRLFIIDAAGKWSEDIPESDTSVFVISDHDSVTPSTFYYGTKNTDITRFKVKLQNQSFDFLVNEKVQYGHYSTTKLGNNDLIFYCGGALIHIRNNKSFNVMHFEFPILHVFEDSDKQIWISCFHDGVYVCDSSLKIISHYLTDLSVSHVFADYERGLWLTTLENGIFYLPSKNNLIFAERGTILQEKIKAIATFSDSVLFFATSKGVLYAFNSNHNTLAKTDVKKEILSSIESIHSLYCIEAKKTLLIAFENTRNALEKIAAVPLNGFKIISSYSCTRFILEDEDLTGSEYYNAYSFNTSSLEKTYLNKKDFHPTVLYKDSRGRLFAGALNNLFIYADSNFIPFDSTNKNFQKRITDIQELDNKYLVIATRSDGIMLYSNTSLETINSLNGLSSDNINHIVVKQNVIWAGTNRGLNKITITSYDPLAYHVQHYNISSGLPSDEINDFTVNGNSIYVATNEGISLINEETHHDIQEEIPLYINSVKINDQDTIVLSSYSLNYTQNTFNIKFAAVSFKQSKNISYLYRLQGQDTTWRSTTNRDVQFTNLPPGHYKFQLLVQSNTNTFPIRPVEINFNISPPFYQSIWFKLVAAFMFWLILFGIIGWRIQSIKKKAEARNALNKKFSELNLNALRSQMNPHFTFNVLNSIQYYIAKKDSESAQLYITKFARLIRMILDQSRTEFISLAEEIKMLTLYIELEELRFENKFSYTIHADEKLNTSSILIPGMLIQPFVENSIRHGINFKKGDAHVDIKFTAMDSLLVCTIMDNGIGRKEAAKLKNPVEGYKSMGTAIVDERIRALSILFDGKLKNYVVDLADENGNAAGTRVTIEIPFKTMLA